MSIDSPGSVSSSALTVNVEFSEPPVPGLARGELLVDNTNAGAGPQPVLFQRLSDTRYQQFFSLRIDGTYTFSLPAGAITDAAGNPSKASNAVGLHE